MLRSQMMPVPAPAPPAFTEAQALAADMAYHRAKVEDPYRQRQADRMAARENELRAATKGMT